MTSVQVGGSQEASIEVTVTGKMSSSTTKTVLATVECSATQNPILSMQVYNYNTSTWANMVTSTQGIGSADATYQCIKNSTTANNNYRTVVSGDYHRMKFKIFLTKSGTTQFTAKFDRFEAGTR